MSNLRESSLLLEASLFLRDFAKALDAIGVVSRADRAKFLGNELKKLASQPQKEDHHG